MILIPKYVSGEKSADFVGKDVPGLKYFFIGIEGRDNSRPSIKCLIFDGTA
jgi:hypothetical protein